MELTNFNLDPIHPGRILKQECMEPLNLTEALLAKKIDVAPASINRLINGKQSITVKMAYKLAKAFGNTPQFWLNLQTQYDITINKDKINLDMVEVLVAS